MKGCFALANDDELPGQFLLSIQVQAGQQAAGDLGQPHHGTAPAHRLRLAERREENGGGGLAAVLGYRIVGGVFTARRHDAQHLAGRQGGACADVDGFAGNFAGALGQQEFTRMDGFFFDRTHWVAPFAEGLPDSASRRRDQMVPGLRGLAFTAGGCSSWMGRLLSISKPPLPLTSLSNKRVRAASTVRPAVTSCSVISGIRAATHRSCTPWARVSAA